MTVGGSGGDLLIAHALAKIALIGALLLHGCRTPGQGQSASTSGASGASPGTETSTTGFERPELVEPDCSRCANGWCRIEPGSFLMGAPFDEPTRAAVSEDPVEVTLTHAFEISQYETTLEEWKALGLPVSSVQGDCTSDDCPTYATWYEAMTFANLESQAHDPPLDPCYELSSCEPDAEGKGIVCAEVEAVGSLYDCGGYRLPTEAEWEYTCRAGTSTAFYDGGVTVTAVEVPWHILTCYDEPNLEPIAWYCTNALKTPHPVGGKWPNPWCLYDILGNLREWTNAGYDGLAYGNSPQTDPGAELAASGRVVSRGGNYYGPPVDATCFGRFGGPVNPPSGGTGVRLVRTLASD